MIPKLSIEAIHRNQTPEQLAANRERSLELVEQYRKAQRELETYCEQNGLEVPIMVCNSMAINKGIPTHLSMLVMSQLVMGDYTSRMNMNAIQLGCLIEQDLSDIWHKHYEPEWAEWKPSVNTFPCNGQYVIQVFLGREKITELK